MCADDGSGELDLGEFTQAVRTDCGLAPAVLSDKDLGEMFKAVDKDGASSDGVLLCGPPSHLPVYTVCFQIIGNLETMHD